MVLIRTVYAIAIQYGVRSSAVGVSVGKSRAAVLRRNERTRVSSASDDEVGGFPARCANVQNGKGMMIQ